MYSNSHWCKTERGDWRRKKMVEFGLKLEKEKWGMVMSGFL